MSLFKQIVEPFLSISSLMMALSLAGIVFSFRKAWSRTGRSCLIANALIFLVVFCSPLAELLLSQLEAMYPPLLKPELCLGARYILVLSAYGVESSSTPITSNLSEETMDTMSPVSGEAGQMLFLPGGMSSSAFDSPLRVVPGQETENQA